MSETNQEMNITALSQIATVPVVKMPTGIDGFDNLLDGGLTVGSTMLMAGQPGAGKSTLLIEVAFGLARQGKRVLYVAGEESPEQIKNRANRLSIDSQNIFLLEDVEVENITKAFDTIKPDVAIIDSLQMLHSPAVKALPGSPSQIRSGLLAINKISKDRGITTVFVGHSTKGGYVAGLLTFQHTVDSVLYLGTDDDGSRFLKVNKNRFGNDNISIPLYMSANGLFDAPDSDLPFGQVETVTFTDTELRQKAKGKLIYPLVLFSIAWWKHQAMKKGLIKNGADYSFRLKKDMDFGGTGLVSSLILRSSANWLFRNLS